MFYSILVSCFTDNEIFCDGYVFKTLTCEVANLWMFIYVSRAHSNY